MCSSVVERCPDKTEVLGPIPSTRTRLYRPFNIMNKKNKTPWWRDGVIIFVKVSSYIAIPIVIASIVGNKLDQKYNSGNLLFLTFIGFAFISTIYLIWKEMKIYKKKIDKEESQK